MRRRQPEALIQRSVFAHIRARGVPGLVAIHPANGGFRRPVEAKILAGLGVTKGAPDVLLWHNNKAFALELKSANGRTTTEQSAMLAKLTAAGVHTALCHGVDPAITCLEGWGLLQAEMY
jgi:hypothetical protein